MGTYRFESQIREKIEACIEIKTKLLQESIPIINKAAEVIIDVYKKGKGTFWFGNGGSAADAQHLACELVNRFYINRKALKSVALTVNTSNLTAIANDFSFNQIFSRQIEALASKGDVLIGISTSGNSQNVIEGFIAGKKIGTVNIGLTGQGGGKMKDYTDLLIAIPTDITPVIQECHIMVGHILCYLIEKDLFPDN